MIFFRSLVAHGTIEASERIIEKPDWTAATTSKLLELLTVKETLVSDIHEYEALKEASTQMLVDIKLCTPSYIKEDDTVTTTMKEDVLFKYTHVLYDNKIGQGIKWTLETSKTMSCRQWMRLVDLDGIAVVGPKGFKV